MTLSKPWYLSRTILASIVTVLAGGAQLLGFPATVDNAVLVDGLLQLVTAVSGFAAILGRMAATDRIG